jgi:hypothetical protein
MQEDKGYLPIQIPGGKMGFVASYTEQKINDYKDNPLIETLPPILNMGEAIDSITCYPDYQDSERELSTELRLHCVGRLRRFVEPIEKHLNIEGKISRCIRDGYIARNPLGKEAKIRFRIVKQAIISGKEIADMQWETRSTASGFAILGISGIGKSTAVERVLSLFPKIIVHSEYKGNPLSFYQLPYIKLDCPSDGSRKELPLQFFKKVDELLGTDYERKFASRGESLEKMRNCMVQVANLHALGVLVIDEIQHLGIKGVGHEKILNFLVTLVNTIGVPVVLIGTPKAKPILQSAFRQARRGAGIGDVAWNRMEQDDEWEMIIETMWGYQWTKVKNDLTDELKATLYEESQGIVDIAVKIYMLAQIEVIVNGKEIITTKTIQKVAKRDLHLVQKFIEALKRGNPDEIALLDDIKPINMKDFIENKANSVRNREAIKTYKEEVKRMNEELGENILITLTKNLMALSIPAKLAENAARKAIDELGPKTALPDLMRRAGEIAYTGAASPQKTESKTKKSKKNPISDECKLLSLLKQARDDKTSAYVKFQENGYIKQPLTESFWLGG